MLENWEGQKYFPSLQAHIGSGTRQRSLFLDQEYKELFSIPIYIFGELSSIKLIYLLNYLITYLLKYLLIYLLTYLLT